MKRSKNDWVKKVPKNFGLSDKEMEELSEGFLDGIKDGDTVKAETLIARMVKNVARFFRKRDDIEFTYQLWKHYYEEAGLELSIEDVEEIRVNMIRLTKRLIDQQGGKNE